VRATRLTRWRKAQTAGTIVACGLTFASFHARADEGGVSFWLPGMYGTLDAVPKTPGFSFSTINYYTTVSASGAIAAQRELQIGRFNPNAKVDLNINLNSLASLAFIDPAYTFSNPLLGGQLTIDMAAVGGSVDAALDGTLTATVGPITATRQGSIADSLTAFGDLYPKATIRWNAGVNNYMTYVTGDIPVGAYSPTRLSNLGIGHGAIDAGGGYTYLNPATGHELSAVTGFTYNLVNPATNYQNGVDWHLDWGAAQFLSKTTFVGINGYIYEQLNNDKGSPPVLGPIRSGVIGIGPQIGFTFPIGASEQGFLSFKAYREFANQDRADGWNAWVTFSISAAAPPPATPTVVARY
jgi:hypothetical protein